jgi:hypothetical protein
MVWLEYPRQCQVMVEAQNEGFVGSASMGSADGLGFERLSRQA